MDLEHSHRKLRGRVSENNRSLFAENENDYGNCGRVRVATRETFHGFYNAHNMPSAINVKLRFGAQASVSTAGDGGINKKWVRDNVGGGGEEAEKEDRKNTNGLKSFEW